MGIFDKVLGKGPDNLTAAEGFAGIAVAAVAADGVVTPDEVQGLAASLSRTRAFKAATPKQVQATFERVLKLSREEGTEGMLKRCAEAVPRDLRPTAFAIAADLVFADGDVSGSERKYLEHIQGVLGVPEAEAVRIVEVMAIKNKA